MKNFNKLKEVLQTKQSFVITTHVNPDADAIGSELALTAILRKFGKNINVINYSETPYFLEFLDSNKTIEVYKPADHDDIIKTAEVIIVADMNDLRRTVKMETVLRESNAYKICIDHHQDLV